jgi:hypothetical protein
VGLKRNAKNNAINTKPSMGRLARRSPTKQGFNMSTDPFNKLMSEIQAKDDAKSAEKRSSDMVNSELRSALRPILTKLEAIEERLINLENALIPKDQ